MADDWDADDFVPPQPKGIVKDSWDDEDVEVKDSWEDEDKPEAPKPKPKAEPAKPKAAAAAKPVDLREMTEEEKKKAQEEADLSHATELFGLGKSLDEISLNSREEGVEYANRLYSRLNKFHNKSNYQEFLEELFKSLCKNLPADTVRKLSNSFKAFSDAKTAQEKAAKQAESKSKQKPKIKAQKDAIKGDINDFLKDGSGGGGGGYDEYDENEDFM